MNKKSLNIVISIFLIFALPMLIFSSFSFNTIWRLACSVFLGFIVGVLLLPKVYIESRNVKRIEGAAVIIGLLGLLSPFYIYLNKERLDNIFDQQETINIENLFSNEEDSHFIFGFDFTEYSNSPTIDENKYLPTFYNLYVDEIRKFKDISKQTKNIKYREFCQARMCADLIHLMDKPGKFSIYFIGGKIEAIVRDMEFTKKNIKWAIQKIYESKDLDSSETHLEEYYEIIYDLVKSEKLDKYDFVKNILFTYSDFMQDKNGQLIHSDLIDIAKLREGKQHTHGLKKYSIIENLFILPHIGIDKQNVSCILKGNGTLYDRRTYVSEDIIEGEENGNSIYNLKYFDIPIYYFENENCSPILEFSDSSYEIKLYNQKEELAEIKLINIGNKKEFPLDNNTYEKIKSKGLYAIKFKGSKASIPIVIDISSENIHVLLELKADKNSIHKNPFKILVISLLFLFGICFPFSVVKILNKI